MHKQTYRRTNHMVLNILSDDNIIAIWNLV
jgi:hypothetical protein